MAKTKRIAALLLVLLMTVYLVFLYKLQIVEGEKYYNRANELTETVRTVTASRGNILDRYGRVLVSNAERYNLKIDTDKLFANEDPNAVILELVELVESYGDEYTDDLPISMEPPFEYLEYSYIKLVNPYQNLQTHHHNEGVRFCDIAKHNLLLNSCQELFVFLLLPVPKSFSLFHYQKVESYNYA